jgi:hypothetical protein
MLCPRWEPRPSIFTGGDGGPTWRRDGSSSRAARTSAVRTCATCARRAGAGAGARRRQGGSERGRSAGSQGGWVHPLLQAGLPPANSVGALVQNQRTMTPGLESWNQPSFRGARRWAGPRWRPDFTGRSAYCGTRRPHSAPRPARGDCAAELAMREAQPGLGDRSGSTPDGRPPSRFRRAPPFVAGRPATADGLWRPWPCRADERVTEAGPRSGSFTAANRIPSQSRTASYRTMFPNQLPNQLTASLRISARH